MNQASDPLIDIAAAILDGTHVTWEDRHTREAPEVQALMPALQALAAIAAACRSDEPAMWGGLRLDAWIGQGAHGEVYRAWDARLEREVALKLTPVDVDTTDVSRTVIEEGRLLARVRHPNVVTIHGAEQIDSRVGLWMEHIDGRTLHQRVMEDGVRFSPREAATIGAAIADALAAVHAAGLLHRDVKAQNVMMDRRGRVVLMDFGAGVYQAAARGPSVAGTPLYLAPELLSGAAGPSVASDIYSLGVLLFFLLTGTYPVSGAGLAEVRAAHAIGERRMLKTVRGDVPRPLRRVVERAMHADPRQRHTDASALRGALLGARDARRRLVTYGGAAAGLAAAAGFVWWLAPAQPNLDAHAMSARARVMAVRQGSESGVQAVRLFEQIIASYPDHAPAHAGLALAYAYASMSPYQGVPFEKAQPAMRAAAVRALELDPQLADAHAARGWVHAREFEWAEAEREFTKAIALNPRDVSSYTSLVVSTLLPLDRVEDAERWLREALRIDPLSAEGQRDLGRVLLQAGRPDAAIAVLEPLRSPESSLPFVELMLARSLVLVGRAPEALPILERQRQRIVDPANAMDPWVAWAWVTLDRRADAERLAEENDRLPFRRAIINGALGRADRMFSGLDEMRAREPQRLAQLLRAPELAGYRSDPRHAQLLRSLRLQPSE